jgi:hypothetical protein
MSQYNQYLPQMTGQNYSNAKWNFNAPQAIGQNNINQSLTGMKSWLAIQSDPMWNMMVANADPSADTFDWGALLPGGGVTGSNAGYGPQAGGGFAAGGTGTGAVPGGAGGTGVPTLGASTPTILSSINSGDELLAGYAQRITNGESPYIMQAEVANNVNFQANPDLANVYTSAIGRMAGEFQNAQQEGQKPGPLAEWYAGTGLPDPNQMYTAEHLPGDFEQALGPDYATRNQGYSDDYTNAMSGYDKLLKGNNRFMEVNDRRQLQPLTLGSVGRGPAPPAPKDESKYDTYMRDAIARAREKSGSTRDEGPTNAIVSGILAAANSNRGRNAPVPKNPSFLGQELTGRIRVPGNSPEAQAAINRSATGDWFKAPGAQKRNTDAGARYVATTPEMQQAYQGKVAAQRVYDQRAKGDAALRADLAQLAASRGRTPAADRQAASLRLARSLGLQV